MKSVRRKILICSLALLFSFSISSYLTAATWKAGSITYGGGNATNSQRVQATTWSESPASLSVHVTDITGTDGAGRLIGYNPGNYNAKYGVDVTVYYSPGFFILNSRTLHVCNGHRNYVTNSSNN